MGECENMKIVKTSVKIKCKKYFLNNLRSNHVNMNNMGCFPSRVTGSSQPVKGYGQNSKITNFSEETIIQTYLRLDSTIAELEKDSPAPRLAGILPLIEDSHEEVMKNEENMVRNENIEEMNDDALSQVIMDLKISENPHLAFEHEEFVANINRQAIQNIMSSLVEAKFNELKETRKTLESEVTKLQLLYKEQDILLDRVIGAQYASMEERSLEASLARARALRDTLSVGARSWRGAAAAAIRAHSLASSAFLAWQLVSQSKDVTEKVRLGREARNGLVAGVHEVRSAQAALPSASFPHCTSRQLQALSLTLEYMFTDMYSKERYEHATRIFSGFSERTMSLASWITNVLKTSLDRDLEEVENDVSKLSSELRSIRVNLIDERGFSDVMYKAPKELLEK